MKETVLRETWYMGETIDNDGTYRKVKYRKIERLGFYIRAIREWYYPCEECQQELKKLLAEGKWILGNKDYEPAIELNTTEDEIDDDSWKDIEKHMATKEEIKRIGIGEWRDI